jgi:hypothetical protein
MECAALIARMALVRNVITLPVQLFSCVNVELVNLISSLLGKSLALLKERLS